ncbi:LOW QUALITY PROTEIN: Protein CBG20782, partial [Caenorhabditis briggsae]
SPTSSSATSSAPSSTSSIRARRNWSVFSERLRETLDKSRKSSSSSTADSLILFDVKCDIDCMWINQRDNSSFDSDLDDFCGDDSHLRIFKFFPPKKEISLHSLASGFDNTGNVRIWPGSEALAWMIQKHYSTLLAPGNRILELGAGFLGLSSFLIAKRFPETTVWITDGNMESISSLEQIRMANPNLLDRIHVRQLIWGEDLLETARFNTILAADCVFFTEYHESLMKCIHTHLAPNGHAVISSPRRKQSLQKFLDYVQASWCDEFAVELNTDINSILDKKIGRIWSSGEEKDEKYPVIELKGALQLGVLKTADSVALRVGGRNGMDMEIHEEVLNQVAAFVWDTVADNWADDLARFTAHAGRQKVGMDDIALLTRRNPDLVTHSLLFLVLTDWAFSYKPRVNSLEWIISKSQIKLEKEERERRMTPLSVSSKPSKEEEEEEDVTILDTLHTPNPYMKRAKIDLIRHTSTPKATEKSLRFPNDITPIRSTDDDVLDISNHVNLSAIPEEDDEQDSFDVFRTTHSADNSSKTITNMSSLVRQAEEHHSSIVEATKDRLENERLERMIPKDDEFDNTSVDSFENYNANEEPAPVDRSAGTPKNAVFSKKMSSFAFDDDDSFDEPVVVVPPPKTTPKTTTRNSKNNEKPVEKTTPNPKSAIRKNKPLQLNHDSFDEFDFDI